MPGRTILPIALILIAIAIPAGSLAAFEDASSGGPAAGIPPAQRIALLPAETSGSEACVRTIQADDHGADLEFVLPAVVVQPLEIEGETYQVIEIEGGGVTGAEGEPMLPTFSRLVSIPARAGVTFEVRNVETTQLFGYRPFPMQPLAGDHFVVNTEAYARPGFPESDRVKIGEPAIARDLRVVPIMFSPLRYDPAGDVIEVATRIQVHVSFAGEDLRNALDRQRHTDAPSYDRMYRSLVTNYEGTRESANSLGCYVLICPNNQDVVNAIQPLVQWRTRKGFEVHVATTAETGTTNTAIKAWLQNAYNTWDNPPEFVTLVGDANGAVAIPSWGNSDLEYVQLAGGDVLPDANVGRISVASVDELRLYVAKIVGYESTPYMADTGWYPRACVVGDAGGCGIPCVQVMQWLKDQLLDWGYTQVDTVFAAPFVPGMTASLNRGVTAFAYRGYIGMSGFGTGNIYALTNGWKMPYAVNITCETGSFESTTSISEAWIRAGVPPSTPTGGIASVGTATAGTHSRYNNCVVYGIWRAILHDRMFTFGESMTRGRYELYTNYVPWDSGSATAWMRYNNLMGDSAGEIWTGVPRTTLVSHPASIPVGSNSVTVSITDHGAPLEGAYVCLWKGMETLSGGYTGSDGTVELSADVRTPGDMLITATAHDMYPYLSTISVAAATRFAGYTAHTIDDDTSGTSSGNGDGLLNPTEQIELPVQVRNFGTETLYGVTATLTSDDPYVTIPDANESYGDLPGSSSAWGDDDFDIVLSGGAPSGHVVRLGLDIHSGADTWHSLIDIPVHGAAFAYDRLTLYNMGTNVDPGESGQISISIRNNGDASATSVTGTLVSQSDWLVVTDAAGGFGNIGIGALGENTTNRFGISAAPDCFQGHIASLMLALQFSGGARDTVYLVLPIGTATSDDPTGPDAYGYYAFDNTDVSYPDAPDYEWVEIAPNHGGQGTDVGLGDFGNNNDAVRTVDLPFAFNFYGETFTRASICSNGWMSMGSTYVAHQLNWNIPAACAPDYLIAAMWDDLYQTGDDRVYQWFDAANHRYIVQWSRVLTAQGSAVNNFEIILYDPVHYPTISGDGVIVIQYDTFNNTDTVQQYSTIGIENGDQTSGLMYGYYNTYNAGAATIVTGRAIKFVPVDASPRGVLTGTVTNATNGGTPISGANVHLVQHDLDFVTGSDGVYWGSVPIGVYTIIAAHPSFRPDTTGNVWVVAGQTTQVDFALDDIAPPLFSGTVDLPNTADEQGPYAVTTTVTEYSDFTGSLVYNVRGTGWEELPLTSQGEGVYSAAIPGQRQGSLIKYYLSAEDAGGNAASDPANAPWEAYEFWVLAPVFSDSIEAGAGDWIHYAVTDTLVDQWHVSELRNHTPGGLYSWKFGDVGTGTYANLADGGLETPAVVVDGETSLTFWHWMAAEVSAAHQGYAYDGGLVEMSLDGGPWTQITPVGGYPYLIRAGSIPGPFPAETPVYSGAHDWEQAQFMLGELNGSLRFRFRFGSDGAVALEGWYLDDVAVVSSNPGLSGNEDVATIPTVLALHGSRPNPFGSQTAQTRIGFDLPQAAAVELGIFDVGGRQIRSLLDETLPPGRYELAWDGRDARGRVLDSGAYFCVLDVNGKRLTGRVLLVR